jgi:hypothetical protein
MPSSSLTLVSIPQLAACIGGGKGDLRMTGPPAPHAAKEQQAFEGWGTSLCWFANVAGGYPDPLREYLADLLFDVQRGLGLQIARYNIGGSGWGCGDVANFRYGANVERCAACCLT